ncbi:MAG: shikimate kinase [Gemmatimonadota bacterium]|nr:MAG: shikimate kinase [Gemmatimonadota bacterium]
MGSAELSGSTLFDRVLLVGFMGSGKTSVGRALATCLGWRFIDFDREIEVQCGRDITSIILEDGESYFREVESQVGATCMDVMGAVLASGGGWPTHPGRMADLPPRTLSVWLQVTAGEAVRRISLDGPTRPLLQVADPVGRAHDLMSEREKWYARASMALTTDDREPAALAAEIAKHVSGESCHPTTRTGS